MQVGPCSSFRYAEDLADLGVTKSFDIVQYNHRSLALAQPLQGGGQATPQLVRFRRIMKRQRNRLRQRSCGPNLPAPLQVERRVGDDAMQPGTEGLARPKSGQRAIRVQK